VVAPKDAVSTAQALGLDPSTVRAALKGASGKGGAVSEGGPGVLFIQSGEQVAPVKVTLGMSDWDFTEVKSGLTGDEKVVLVAAAQLSAQQQQQTDRMKQRMSGPVPGVGGAGRRGGK
jgi:HlyD family secretion protein